MQLFLLDYINLTGNDITIDNPEIWQQAKKVLRLGGGDQIFVQGEKTRYEVEISRLQDLKIFGKIINTIQAPANTKQVSMIIAMPNKREKAELIVQKLTEIGVDEIIFRPSERSVIKVWNENKVTRLEKIMKEAVEQSRGRALPKISFVEKIEHVLQGRKIIVFDKSDNTNDVILNKVKDISSSLDSSFHSEGHEMLIGLVGPEGGRGPKDYELFKKYDIEAKDLGATVLRMETAAIVGAWVLKNGL